MKVSETIRLFKHYKSEFRKSQGAVSNKWVIVVIR